MKRVLIIAYFFPPMRIIGSQRPYKLARYLRNFDWDAVALTIKRSGDLPGDVKVITTGYTDRISFIKRMAGLDTETGVHEQLGIPVTKNFDYPTLKSKTIAFLRQVVAFPDSERGWYQHAVTVASHFLDTETVDAVISTSFPATSHLIARKIKQKYGIPWVADLRDLWTQNHYYGKFKIIKYFEKRLEAKTLSHADMLVTVSESLAGILRKVYRHKEVHCITNGYDPEDFNESPELTRKFTITYTGNLYNGKRDPSMLFETIASLIADNKIVRDMIEIRFFGEHEEWLINDIKRYRLSDVAKVYGSVSREEAIKRQQESQLLLLLLWNNKEEKGVYTGKLFEYMGSCRPIIAIGGTESVVKDLFAETDCGRFAENKFQLKEILLQYYKNYIDSGTVKYASNNKIKDYTYNSIAGKYSSILNKVVLK